MSAHSWAKIVTSAQEPSRLPRLLSDSERLLIPGLFTLPPPLATTTDEFHNLVCGVWERLPPLSSQMSSWHSSGLPFTTDFMIQASTSSRCRYHCPWAQTSNKHSFGLIFLVFSPSLTITTINKPRWAARARLGLVFLRLRHRTHHPPSLSPNEQQELVLALFRCPTLLPPTISPNLNYNANGNSFNKLKLRVPMERRYTSIFAFSCRSIGWTAF